MEEPSSYAHFQVEELSDGADSMALLLNSVETPNAEGRHQLIH